MDKQQLREETRRVAGLGMAELFPDTVIDAAVQETIYDWASTEVWPTLEAEFDELVPADENYLDLPSTVRKVQEVRTEGTGLDGPRVLTRRSPEAFEQAYPGARSAPSEYVLRDGKLWLFPTPSRPTVVHVRHTIAIPKLVADTDEPDWLDEEFHEGLVYGAASLLLVQEAEGSDRKELFETLYQSYIQRARERYLWSDDLGMFQVGSRASVDRGHKTIWGLG